MSFPRASQALARFTVLDLTQVSAGPTAVRQLADWGANVIKIEPPARLLAGEPPGGPRDGPDFQNLHRNKRSLTLDLKSPEGLAAFLRLAGESRRGRRELPAGRQSAARHRLRGCGRSTHALSTPAFPDSVRAGRIAIGPASTRSRKAWAGSCPITGLPGQGPVRVGLPIADLAAGLFCALGILVALLEREKSGEGQWVETSLLEAQIFMLDFQAARWLIQGRSAAAGRQQSSDQHSDRRVQDRRRLHQHRHHRPDRCGSGSRARSARRRSCSVRNSRLPAPALKNRDALNAALEEYTSAAARARTGSSG